MSGLRRTLSLALLALLLVLVAGPVAAAQCRMGGACPMMRAAAPAAPCHGAEGSGGMSAPMDCCLPQAVPVPAGAPSGLEPSPVVVPSAVSGAALAVPAVAAATFSRVGQQHLLGLFTLHSVWRI